ncbi:MAG: hypothetical protein RLZZ399_222 [Verrucomicrobiota bacterium]|jgi:flagellar L-ring protein precursor FlgH
MRGFLRLFFITSVFSSASLFAGSLWREAVTDERGMFADKIARRVGDIVTVVVEESVVSSNALTLKTAKTSGGTSTGLATNLAGQFVAGTNEKLTGEGSLMGKFPLNILPRPSSGLSLPTPSGQGNATFDSGGEMNNTQKVTSRMAVQVIDKLPNGNLVIEGIRQVSFSKERQFASLRGIIRPFDISITNTVPSTSVADARIDIVAEGALTNAQRKGWLLRLDEKISPY